MLALKGWSLVVDKAPSVHVVSCQVVLPGINPRGSPHFAAAVRTARLIFSFELVRAEYTP